LLTHGDLDERALDALKEFPAEGGIAVLKEFRESNLEHVSNKSAYLCGVMKTYRQKNKMMGGVDAAQKKGPDEDKIKASCVYLIDKTRQPIHYKNCLCWSIIALYCPLYAISSHVTETVEELFLYLIGFF